MMFIYELSLCIIGFKAEIQFKFSVVFISAVLISVVLGGQHAISI